MIIEQQSKVVLSSLNALLETFARKKELISISDACTQIFISKNGFKDNLIALDALIKKSGYAEIEEIIFDLMLVHFLSAYEHQEDFFDSDDWLDIEEQTVDRGTELLNLFLYINEANDADAEISINDFLNEFLLADMDEFQDEFKIYAPLIENDFEEADFEEITALRDSLKDDSEIKEILVPMVLFFKNPHSGNLVEHFNNKLNNFEISVLASLMAFTNTK
jgi:hypothetical protein